MGPTMGQHNEQMQKHDERGYDLRLHQLPGVSFLCSFKLADTASVPSVVSPALLSQEALSSGSARIICEQRSFVHCRLCARCDDFHNMLGVSSHAVHRSRSHGVQELQTKEVQPWHVSDYASIVQGITGFIENG